MPRIEGFIKPEKVLDRVEVSEGAQVADLGCGAGFFSLTAANFIGETGKVYAIDIQQSALSAVEDRAHLQGLEDIIKLVWADLEVLKSTKIKKNSIDLAIVVDVLFQNEGSGKILQEAQRMVKSDGKILIIDWKTKKLPLGPLPDNRISEHKVKQLAEGLGLKLVDSWDPSPYHYALVYKK